MAIKLDVFNLRGDVLSRITQDVDLYTSAKFRAFNTNLNSVACCLHHFQRIQELLQINVGGCFYNLIKSL